MAEANVVWPPPDEEVEQCLDAFPTEASPGGDSAPRAPSVALEAILRAKLHRPQIVAPAERHFSLTAAQKPTISVPVAFLPARKRRARVAGILGVAAAVTLLIFTVPTTPEVATLVVRSEPAGAMVMVDGVVQGRTPIEAELAPGEYLVELRRGEQTWRTPVAVRAGVQVVNYFALGEATMTPAASRASSASSSRALSVPTRASSEARASTPPSASLEGAARDTRPASRRAHGWLAVSPDSRVTLLADGELLDLIAAGERRQFSLTPGDHELEIVYESGARETRTLEIAAGRVARLDIDPRGRAGISTPGDVAAGPEPADEFGDDEPDAPIEPPRPRDQSLPPLSAAPFPVPENARAVVELQIDARGRVAGATLQQSINSFYDKHLLGALQHWRYEPAQRGGQAVASTDVVEIAPGPSRWSITR